MKKYTKEEILRAAEIGEVSLIDAKHIISLLDEARDAISLDYHCYSCIHSFSNPFDQYYCTKKDDFGRVYDIENGYVCGGKYFESKRSKK